MAITTEEQTTLLSLVVTMFDAAPGAANLEAIVSIYEANGNDIAATADALAGGPLFTAQFDGKSNAEIAEQIASNFGLEKNSFIGYDAEGQFAYDYILAALDGGADLGGLLLEASTYLQTAAGAAALPTAAATLANKTTVAEYYSVTKAASANTIEELMEVIANVDATDSSVTDATATIDEAYEGQTFKFTSDTDALVGTSFDDIFLGYLAQNTGGTSNTLSTADSVDGGEGTDTLEAKVIAEFAGNDYDNNQDIQFSSTSVENMTFEVTDDDTTVTVDAKDMTGVEKIGSSFSDGDLIIENLTTLTDSGEINAVSSMTIVMDHTENSNTDGDASDLSVYFDEDYLTPTTSYGSDSIIIEIMNQDAYDANSGADRLDGVYIDKFNITLDGQIYDLAQYIIEDPQGLGDEFKTEAELVAYLNGTVLPALIADNPAVTALESLVFTIGGTWNDDNQNRIGDQIVLTVDSPSDLSISDADIVLGQADSVDASYASNRIERTNDADTADSESMSVNIELEKVGRDGEGGNLIVGGENDDAYGDTDVDQKDGIPIFNITVNGDEDLPSNLGFITSTNGTLTTVNIASEARTDGSYAALTVRGDATSPFGGTLETLNANSFLGDLAIGADVAASNIDTFTATGGGDVTLNEVIDGTENGVDYSITTAGGEDNINVMLVGDAVDTNDESFAVSTGGADDSVMITMDNDTTVSRETTQALDNLTVDTGAGDDYVEYMGENQFIIDTQAGSDFVNIKSVGNGDSTLGQWLVHNSSAGVADSDNGTGSGFVWTDTVLYKATLTVTFAGIEETVTIATDSAGNFIATEEDINAAIISAIGNNAELTRLLTVTEGTGDDNQIIIDSTVDGLNDLTIEVDQAAYSNAALLAALSATEEAAMEAGLISNDDLEDVTGIVTVFGDSATPIAITAVNTVFLSSDEGSDGANDTLVQNDSIIDVATGTNDLISLASNTTASNTVVFEDTNMGKTTIINWFDDQNNGDISYNGATLQDATTGDHVLDFTYWLDDEASTSGSSASALRIATTVTVEAAAGVNLTGNEVVVVNDAIFTVADTFAGMTATDVQSALNSVTNYATISTGLQTDNTAGYQSTLSSILMIENTDNNGEYSVFAVENTDNTTADTFTVTAIGIVDFGETIDTANALSAANFA